MGAYEEKWQLQYKCIRTAFNPKYIAPDLNIVHRSSRGEAKLPINTIAAHFLAFSRAALQLALWDQLEGVGSGRRNVDR